MILTKSNNDDEPRPIRVKKDPSQTEREILDYLTATGGYQRRRKIRFPQTEFVEDYGIGLMAPFIDKTHGGFDYTPPEKRSSKDILNYLTNYYENPGPFGYNVGRKSFIPKSIENDPLTVYEETIHGAQAPRGFFNIDKTLGKGVGKTKREFFRQAEEAFRGTGAEEMFQELVNYNGGFGLPNMEAEAKPMALKAAMRNLGVIDDYVVKDSDIEKIREWFVQNEEQQNDPFSWLFSEEVIKKDEYRKALLDYLNSF
jgi:hypothetical protein